MFDTVKWSHDLSNHRMDFAARWEWTNTSTTQERYKQIHPTSFSTLKLTAARRFGVRTLEIETSLPKLIYGNNVQMLGWSDLNMATDAVSDLVRDETGVDFNPLDAELSRLDVGHNWRLESQEEVVARVRITKNSEYTRRKRVEIEQDGIPSVCFRNRGKRRNDSTRLYSKLHEKQKLYKNALATAAVVEDARCVLRLERELHRSALKAMKLTRLSLITPTRVEEILIEAMTAIGLDREQVGGDERFITLREYLTDSAAHFNGRRYRSLRGTLAVLDELGTLAKAEALMFMSRPTFYKDRKDLQCAGVWGVGEKSYMLAPLTPPRFPE